MSETNCLVSDHLEFVLEVDEEEFGPCQLPRRILKDHKNPQETMRLRFDLTSRLIQLVD
jgi:hypothetical protein